jgi:hypothetical protein
MKQMRDILGHDKCNNAYRRADKRLAYILRPSRLKRHTKRMLPESSFNLLSGLKVEVHLHGIKYVCVLVFHRNFTSGAEEII